MSIGWDGSSRKTERSQYEARRYEANMAKGLMAEGLGRVDVHKRFGLTQQPFAIIRLPDPDVYRVADHLSQKYAYRIAKWLFDIVFSLLAIVLFSWLFRLVALAIKIGDPKGPIIFKQLRMGKGGRTFRMWRFRSTYADAEERLAALQALNEKDGSVFKIKDDPRITRIGRLIRKTSLDEFPQLFNTFRDDILLRILKIRPEFFAENMGAFALPAKSSTNESKVSSQVTSCFVSGLRVLLAACSNSSLANSVEVGFLAKLVFGRCACSGKRSCNCLRAF